MTEPAARMELHGRVPEGGWDALEEFAADAAPFYERPGGIRFRLVADDTDPRAFRLVFGYFSRRELEADAERLATDATMKGLSSRLESLVEGEITRTVHVDAS